MTGLITQATQEIITSSTYGWLSATFGAIAIVLLVLLLIQKEVLRTVAESRATAWMRAFNLAIAPLLLGFGLIVAMRLVVLLSRNLR